MSASNDQALSQRAESAKKLVSSQRELFEREFGRVESEWKKDGSRVTAADHAISRNILDQIAKTYPEDQGFSEELLVDEPLVADSEFAWVLDPIDGTNNFATGLAQCAISLALLREGEPVYGVVYDHSRRTLLHGGPGFGMWDGARRASIVTGGLKKNSLVGFHSPHEKGRFLGHADALVSRTKIRGLGSSALHLAYVAAGIFDGTVDHNVKLWDIAAGLPMIKAAGGEAQFIANNPLPLRLFDLEMPRIFYVAGSSEMCRDLRDLLQAP